MSDLGTPAHSLHGFLVIDKPAGWTSHDVVARVRRLVHERRVGHAGTLDPAATGVLPVAVGSATRVLEYLADASKSYLAEITFGVETETEDIEGRVVAVRDSSGLTAEAVEDALTRFRGPIAQVPPMHSAVKVGGRRLYDLARRGEVVERAPRHVAIHALTLLRWQPPVATVCVDCSKGTYIRALARDLGAALGVGAYLSDLVRLRTGPFTLCDALTLDQVAAADLPADWPAIAYHADVVVEDWPALILDEPAALSWRQGRSVPAAPTGGADGPCRAYGPSGDWLGIGRGEPGERVWRPTKVVGAA